MTISKVTFFYLENVWKLKNGIEETEVVNNGNGDSIMQTL